MKSLFVCALIFTLGNLSCKMTQSKSEVQSFNPETQRLVGNQWITRSQTILSGAVEKLDMLKPIAQKIAYDSSAPLLKADLNLLQDSAKEIFRILVQVDGIIDDRNVSSGQQKIIDLNDFTFNQLPIPGLTTLKTNLSAAQKMHETDVVGYISTLQAVATRPQNAFSAKFAAVQAFEKNIDATKSKIKAVISTLVLWQSLPVEGESNQNGSGFTPVGPCAPTATKCDEVCPRSAVRTCQVVDCNGVPFKKYTESCAPPPQRFSCTTCSRTADTQLDQKEWNFCYEVYNETNERFLEQKVCTGFIDYIRAGRVCNESRYSDSRCKSR